MTRKVKFARFHQSIHLAGLGDMGPTLPNPTKTVPDLDMEECFSGIQVLAKGIRFVVPYANVVIYSYEEPTALPKQKITVNTKGE